jgi:hypothetical protein
LGFGRRIHPYIIDRSGPGIRRLSGLEAHSNADPDADADADAGL